MRNIYETYKIYLFRNIFKIYILEISLLLSQIHAQQILQKRHFPREIGKEKIQKRKPFQKQSICTRVHLSSLRYWSSPVLQQVQSRSCKLVSELSSQLKMIKSIVLLCCYFKVDWVRSFLPFFSTYVSLKSRNEKSSLLSFKKSEVFLEP